MGFFRSLKQLNDIGREHQRNFDVKATMAASTLAMQQAAAAMAPVAVDEARLVPATATITGARQTGTSIGIDPMLELGLLVIVPGGVPTPVTVTTIVPQLYLSRMQPGGQVAVVLDPSNAATTTRIDWTRAA